MSFLKKPVAPKKPTMAPIGAKSPVKPLGKPAPIKKDIVSPATELVKETIAEEIKEAEKTATEEFKTVEEVTQVVAPEVKEVIKEDVKIEEAQEEKAEEVVPEIVEEVKPKRTRTRKKKEEVSTDTTKTESDKNEVTSNTETVSNKSESKLVLKLPTMSIEEAEEYMNDTIDPTTEAWELEKQEVLETANVITIDPDANPATIKQTLADLSNLVFEISNALQNAENMHENMEEQLKIVQNLNGVGSNGETRKYNATVACLQYKKNPEDELSVNLYEYLRFARAKAKFYNGVMKQLEIKRQLLITFNGMLNIESRL